MSYVALLGFFWQCSGKAGNGESSVERTNTLLTVEAVVLQPQHLENKITTTGTILANEEVDLKSEINGRVVSINFEGGSRIKRGQLLVKLDDSDLKAQLKKLKVEVEYAKQGSSRQAQLMEVSATTQEVYDAALNRLKIAQADIELVTVQIDKTEIRAPFNGVIGLRQVSEGSYLTPASIISQFQEIDPVKVEFKVPEKYAGRVTDGMKVNYKVTSSNKEFSGIVYAVEPRIDANTRTVTVRAKTSNPKFELFPGGFAEIDIVLEVLENALVVPSQAVIPELNGQVVYLYKSGKAKQVAVEVGVRAERTIHLSSGVMPRDTVITTGLLQLKDDLPIEIKSLIDNDNVQNLP